MSFLNLTNLRLLPGLSKLADVKSSEWGALFWSLSYFFSLLCSYYIIRPMRDEMGILGGVENLQWLFTGTLLAMTAAIPLFGWLNSRFPRRQYLLYVYFFFILMLLSFYGLMGGEDVSKYVARAFFIWVSVFNLFIVSVFWSFMADLYSNTQAKRLFGFVAAGGTLGALTGPALTTIMVQPFGMRNMLLLSALFLAWSIVCIIRLSAWSDRKSDVKNISLEKQKEQAIGGGIWAGISLVFRSPYLISICLLMILYTTLATFLYLMQAQIIRDAFVDSAQRTAVFATIDLVVNAMTLLIQIFFTSRLIKWFGLAIVLAIVPVLLALGFTLLGIAPTLAVLLVVQVTRRAGNYAVMKPARELLYVVLRKEEKYKAKIVIDTVVYRAGDAVSAWVYSGMRSLGINLSGIALIAVPLALLWAVNAYGLGRKQIKIARSLSD